jgi:hypothetical protein
MRDEEVCIAIDRLRTLIAVLEARKAGTRELIADLALLIERFEARLTRPERRRGLADRDHT